MRKLLMRFFAAVLCVVALAAMASLAQPRGLVEDENGRAETQTDAAPPAIATLVKRPTSNMGTNVPPAKMATIGVISMGMRKAVVPAEAPGPKDPDIGPVAERSEATETDNETNQAVETEEVEANRYAAIVGTITDDERDMLTRLVYHESRGDGGEYVMEVVLNRMLDDEFPDDVTDVVYQKNQFSPAQGLYSYPINEPDAFALCQDIVDEVLSPDYQPQLPAYYLYFNSIAPESDDYVWKGGNVFYGYA